MTPETLFALALFALSSSITPGPNNLMLMTSSANFGFRRTIPHMMGISGGFVLMVFLVGLGLIELFEAFPQSYTILRVLSVCYLLFLAWRIWRSAAISKTSTGAKPLRFIEAAAFQWVNPKAWAMALTAISVYAPDTEITTFAIVAAVFGAINLPSVTVWALIGLQVARILTNPLRRKLFNTTMALLLVASLYPVLASF